MLSAIFLSLILIILLIIDCFFVRYMFKDEAEETEIGFLSIFLVGLTFLVGLKLYILLEKLDKIN